MSRCVRFRRAASRAAVCSLKGDFEAWRSALAFQTSRFPGSPQAVVAPVVQVVSRPEVRFASRSGPVAPEPPAL